MDQQLAPRIDASSSRAFLLLSGLAAVEFGVALFPIGKLFSAVLLLALACLQAVLVARYFMHLKAEHSALSLIVLTPMILVVLLVFTLVLDLPVSSTP